MRIISGIARGMTLRVPRGADTRPTSDRVREAIFSSLGQRVVEARVLDLFAGTGALGLEALSRGAASAVFVEQSRTALRSLRENVAEFARRDPSADDRIRVVAGDVFDQLQRLPGPFGVVFADPPYATVTTALLGDTRLTDLFGPQGVFVLESAEREALTIPSPWCASRHASYGDTRVTFLCRISSPPSAGRPGEGSG